MESAKVEHLRPRIVQERSSQREKLVFSGGKVKTAMKQKSKSKRRSQHSCKLPTATPSEVLNGDESAETEPIDRLLSSSLRLWEVEREIIEERQDARKSKDKKG